MLLLQEFDIEIKDKSGKENLVTDHLSRIVSPEDGIPICDTFPDEHLFAAKEAPWYADIVNYLVTSQFPQIHPVGKKIKSRRKRNDTYGTSRTFGSTMQIK